MPSEELPGMEELARTAREQLASKHAAREEGLRLSREIIRFSANAIRAVHRQEFDGAKELLKEAGDRLADSASILQRSPEIYFAGFLSDARKEYAEACITLALISGTPIPQPKDLGIEVAPYLNGMGEVIGEVRRFILDSLRRDSGADCERYMDVMEEIYTLLVTLDFPEGVTGGLRRTTDMMRGALERTRGDLTMALVQRQLEAKLSAWQRDAPSPPVG